MKALRLGMSCLALSLTLTGCDLFGPEKNDEPNVPLTFNGRPVNVLGTITVQSKDITFFTWDSGLIDGDIISLVVNGTTVLSNYELTGNKFPVQVALEFEGYNYVMLFAHNEGDIPPNTAALSVDDGVIEQDLILSADLSTNGAYNVIVQ